MVRFSVFPLVCSTGVLVTAGWVAQAQKPSPEPPPPMQAASQAAPPVPLFRTNANLVLVDVVVRNKQQAVAGLKKSDFHVSEDGREQKITVFEEHGAADSTNAAQLPQLPPDVYTNYPQYHLTSAANVLLMDGLNTPLADQKFLRHDMLKYLSTVPSGTQVAVFTLGSRLSMITGFTTDPAEVAKALGPGRGQPQKSPVLDPDLDDAFNLHLNLAQALGLSDMAVSQLRQFVSDNQNFEVALREQMTLDALDEIGRYLSTIPGRKNLIWFSASFPIRFLQGGTSPNVEPMADFGGRVKKTAELLALSRVAVYPVDSRGLLNEPSAETSTVAGIAQSMFTAPVNGSANGLGSQASVSQTPSPSGNQGMGSYSMDQQGTFANASQGGAAGDLNQRNQTFQTDLTWDHFNMDQIAKETGGIAYYNRNALGKVLNEAIANGSSYYTIGYSPENHMYNGALRQIAVDVEGQRYDLEYRHAYFADNPDEASKLTPGHKNALTDAMEHGTPPLSQVVFNVRVLPAGSSVQTTPTAASSQAGAMAAQLKNPRHYTIDYWIDPRELEHKALPDGGQETQVELTEVAYDEYGVRLNYVDQALSVSQTQQQAARSLQAGLPLHQQIDLPSGKVYLRVGVHDMASGRIGSLEIAVPEGN